MRYLIVEEGFSTMHLRFGRTPTRLQSDGNRSFVNEQMSKFYLSETRVIESESQ